MWINRLAYTLLVGLQIDSTTLKKIWHYLLKLEIHIPFICNSTYICITLKKSDASVSQNQNLSKKQAPKDQISYKNPHPFKKVTTKTAQYIFKKYLYCDKAIILKSEGNNSKSCRIVVSSTGERQGIKQGGKQVNVRNFECSYLYAGWHVFRYLLFNKQICN